MSLFPNTFYRVSVKAVIRNDQREVLLVKENQDTWSLPGGGLDHGENPVAGLRRELQEELHLETINAVELAGSTTFYLERKRAWLLWLVYDVEAESRNIKFGEGVTDARFMDVAELSNSNDVFEQAVCRALGHIT